MTDTWREMTFADAKIDHEFRCGNTRWRMTDVGTRVVVAIKIDPVEIATSGDGRITTEIASFREADRRGWFNGPPYGVAEHVSTSTIWKTARSSHDRPPRKADRW